MLSKSIEGVRFAGFKVHNLVLKAATGFPIKITKLSQDKDHGSFTHFEPEIFPGLFYKIFLKEEEAQNSKLTAIVFANGKIVLTGAKDKAVINNTFEAFKKVLKRFINT